MYRARVAFNDLQDNERSYAVGEVFPRPGLRVTAERLQELSGTHNRMGFPLIVEVHDEAKPEKKPTRKRVKKDD